MKGVTQHINESSKLAAFFKKNVTLANIFKIDEKYLMKSCHILIFRKMCNDKKIKMKVTFPAYLCFKIKVWIINNYVPYVLDCPRQSRILILCQGISENIKLSPKFKKNKVERFFKTN